ncbi:hypothetical protein BDV18DRAFT_157004 [Aspergillus unguis]
MRHQGLWPLNEEANPGNILKQSLLRIFLPFTCNTSTGALNFDDQSGAPFGSSHRKRSWTPRNASGPFQQQREPGYFNARRDSRFGFGPEGHNPPPPPPPSGFNSWQARNVRVSGNSGSPPLRPFDTTPPAIPYDIPPPQRFYPPMPHATDRAFGGPFRRSAEYAHQEHQNRLFLDEYRFPGPHQAYQPPHIDAHIQAPSELAWRGESPYELMGPPLAQSIQLRGDAPEFVPRWKTAVNEEPVLKPKDCWFVVSST